jgi:TonB-linked SusC/RagA family outer membrane protein
MSMRKTLTFIVSMLLLTGSLLAQNRTVTGKVTDNKGNPISNATILIKGTTTGTSTNEQGNFSLSVPDNARVLTISSVTYASRDVAIGKNNTISVALEPGDQSLQEVVVTSFGIKRDKTTLGYSAPVIKGEELTAVRNSNITNSLVGKVPGLRVQGSGGSFTSSSVLIRGYTSVTGASAPLYVIDGVPVDNSGGGTSLQTGTTSSSRIVDVNPDDIENMTVLKGAAATSSYGSRGAGGVILITTKKGKRRSKNNVEFVSSYNVVEVNRLPEYQNEYAQGVGGVLNLNNSSSWGPRIDGRAYTDFYGKQTTLQAYPDNVKDMFKKGFGLQNTVSFSGGSDKTSYRVSYGNTEETWVLDKNRLNKNNLTINLNSDVTSKLNIGTFINFTNTKSIRTQQGNQLSNPVFRSWFTPRSYDLTGSPYYDANGNQSYYAGEDNPYWSIENVRYNDEVNRVFGNLNLNYKILDWLTADLKVGLDYYNTMTHGFDDIGVRGGGNTNSGGKGGVREANTTVRNLNSYFTINGTKNFGDFTFSGTIGNEAVDQFSKSSTVTGVTLSVRGFDQMSNAATYTPSFGISKARTLGLFGDFVIEYQKWLSLNLKARNDWVSTLPKASQSVFYPAAALSFVLTEAFPTIKSDFVNNIKLRANLGKVGRGPTAYNTLDYASSANPGDGFGPNIQYPFNGYLGYTLSSQAGNPDLKPEFTTEWEIGTDVSLWNNRVILEANYYQRKLTEGLFPVPASPTSGVSTQFKNAGQMETKGVELSLTVVPLKLKDFTWTVSSNFTAFKTTVTQLAPGVKVITLGGFTTPNIRLMAGETYPVIYGNKYVRDNQGRLVLNANGLPTATNDVSKIGDPNPKFLIGLSNTFSYKGFVLDVMMDIRSKGDIYSRNLADLRRNGVVKETAEFARYDKDGILQKPYKFDGVDASGNAVNIPLSAEQYWGNSGKYVAAEGYIVSTSWVRVREANLSYRLPKKITDKTPFGNIEFGVFGRNLFLWTSDYPHLDPEQNVLGSSNAQGLEFNANASTRTLGVNMRITF